MARTLFERYGGFAVISKLVMAFYDRVLDSPILGPYFDHVDLRALIDHQTKFISQVMGGPVAYSDDQLEHVHRHLAITPEAFAAMITMMRETLVEFAMDPEDIERVVDELERRRGAIIAGPR